ncbi:MAG: hypothetical protein L0387_12980 [Acidobacteria bacterium]|nr:hypothetical protein [Acidobacteriota bacterium]
MLSTRLIEMIEKHSDEIAQQVLDEVREDKILQRYHELPDALLRSRFENVGVHLSQWLKESDETALARHFEALGRERFEEQIPLHEVIHAAQIFKHRLAEFAREHCFERTPIELHAELELERLLNAFFDRIVFHIARGHEEALGEEIAIVWKRGAAKKHAVYPDQVFIAGDEEI